MARSDFVTENQNVKQPGIEMAPPKRAWQRQRERLKAAAYPVGTVLVVLVVWQLAVMVFHIPRYLLPAPTAIISGGIEFAPFIAPHYVVTLYESSVGLLFAILVGVPFALVISYSPFLYRSFYPLMVWFDEIPKVAYAPIFVTWFGFGLAPKIILTFLVCLFPIFLNGIAGFKNINPKIADLGRAAGAREWEMFWKIRLPNALPNLFVGLKIAASGAMVGAVVSEFLAAERGLGFFLQKALSLLRMDVGFAIIVAMWTIGVLFFYGMTLLESWAIRWHVSKRAGRKGQVS
jgi:NitT/TauT family transport system permease protein